jgi:hypothetical protein
VPGRLLEFIELVIVAGIEFEAASLASDDILIAEPKTWRRSAYG